MADVSGITAVKITSNTVTETVTYGATIAVGQTVYLDNSDNEHKLADASADSTDATRGVAVTPGGDGEAGIIAKAGDIELVGATLAVGENYVQSATAGAIAPEGDLTTGDYCTTIGRATTGIKISLAISASGVQHA